MGSDEWNALVEICGDDTMHLELMAKLLDTERQYHTKYRRVGIYESLEKCFDTSSRSQEEAIQNAQQKRTFKVAAEAGDVETIKQQIKQLNKSRKEASNRIYYQQDLKVSSQDISFDSEENTEKVEPTNWASIKYPSRSKE